VLALVATGAFAIKINFPKADLDNDWALYKKVHHKNYRHNEDLKRRLIWERNVDKVATHNRQYDMGESTYTLAINKFADLTHEEFVANFTGRSLPRRSKATKIYTPTGIDPNITSVDWRDEGAVTAIKDQGSCGSCWAFSTTGSLEGQTFLSTGNLVSLSEQNLVDCSQAYGPEGCDGGWMDDAMDYIQANGGINTEADYPYEGVDDTCRYDSSLAHYTLTGHVDIAKKSEDDLLDAVTNIGPISVAIDASEELQLYASGILDDDSCRSRKYFLNHGVLAIGYGATNDVEYWLVKNSWGTDWGEEGFFQLRRNANNQCGIATVASFPTV